MNVKGQDWYFISAGEYSGDLLAANFVLSLSDLCPQFRAFGMVGEAMRAARVDPILDMKQVSVMGIADVARRLGELRLLEKQLLHQIDQRRPRFAILVDFPGLHFRLAEQLHLRGIPVIQYVAPKVWAWREKRIENLRRDFDLVLGVLPFEEDFFRGTGVNYKFIGSPHKDRTSKVIVTRESLGLQEKGRIVGMLPGSRESELAKILPKMMDVVKRLRISHPDTQFIMPLANNLSVETMKELLPMGVSLEEGEGHLSFAGIRVVKGMSLEVMAVSDLTIIASGTATLECGLLGTPMVVMYVTDHATYEIAQKAVKVPYISLVNLIAGKEVVKEFIQYFSTDDVADEAISLFEGEKRQLMQDELHAMRDTLPGNASYVAAMELTKYLQDRGIVQS